MKKIILLISFIVLGITTQATVHVVSSKNNSGTGTLRSKIATAVSGDTIRFNPNLLANGSDSIVLNGEIAFGKSLTITGLYTPTDTLFISGGGTNRMFKVDTTTFVVFDSLVLINGFDVSHGGAMFVQNVDSVALRNSTFKRNRCGNGNLYFHISPNYTNGIGGEAKVFVDHCDINNNKNSPWGSGGGIYCASQDTVDYFVEVRNSSIRNNKGASINSYGGGLYVAGVCGVHGMNVTVHVLDSKIQGNSANYGGGIYIGTNRNNSFLYVKGSTISGNTDTSVGQSYGTGISSYSNSGGSAFIEVEGSTISNNKADSCVQGGGIYCCSVDSTRSVIVKNSTIANNDATYGGGIFIQGYTNLNPPIFTIESSIVGLNGTSNMSINQSATPTFTSLGYNIFSDSALVDTVSTDQLNIDSASLNLSSLSYNGGYTPTMMPIFPSVAINNGNPLDTSAAQNGSLIGVRDVGASENCGPSHRFDTIVAYDNYTWIDGITYSASDTVLYFKIGSNSVGCDSLVSLYLTIKIPCRETDTITTCDNYVWRNGLTYYSNNNSAEFLVVDSMGCDSIYTLNLNITNSFVEVVEACELYTWRNGVTYTQSNFTAQDTVVVAGSCDSIFILNLTMRNSEYSTDIYTVCDSLTWINGVTYYSSTNTVYDTLANRHGCDSIVNLDLTINQSHHDTDNISACLFYMWSNGQIYVTHNNTATQNFTSTIGCDSILHLDLQIHQGTFATDTHVVCDSLVWIDGNTYYANNTTALHTLVGGNSNGCDSVVTLNLTVNGSSSTDVINSCGAYTWIDGNTYTSSNNAATHTYTNSLGCDSVVTLNLTINGTTYGTETVSACDNYTWNGTTYTSSNNMATDTHVNAFGCDSIITLDLTILQSTSATDVISSCDPIIWLDGNTYSSSNNTATHTITNTAGCDSVITLDFTLLQPTAGTDVVSSCTEITWMDGNVYSATTSGPTFTIPNAAGCDSVVTLDFILLEVDTTVVRNYLTLTAQGTNATYQWIDCDNGVINGETNAAFTATQNGDYQVEVTQNGCVDTSACFSITNVGIQQAQLLGVNVYPNPTSDVLHIDKGSNVSLEITITNSAGAIVYHSSTEDQITTIQMAKMASGVYVVTLRNELGVSVERIVKR